MFSSWKSQVNHHEITPEIYIEISQVMIFVMSEQLASWVPSLYREASLEDVQQGRR